MQTSTIGYMSVSKLVDHGPLYVLLFLHFDYLSPPLADCVANLIFLTVTMQWAELSLILFERAKSEM